MSGGGGELLHRPHSPNWERIPHLQRRSRNPGECRRGRAADPIDVVYSYSGAGIEDPTTDVDRHWEATAALEKAGVTWILVSEVSPTGYLPPLGSSRASAPRTCRDVRIVVLACGSPNVPRWSGPLR